MPFETLSRSLRRSSTNAAVDATEETQLWQFLQRALALRHYTEYPERCRRDLIFHRSA